MLQFLDKRKHKKEIKNSKNESKQNHPERNINIIRNNNNNDDDNVKCC